MPLSERIIFFSHKRKDCLITHTFYLSFFAVTRLMGGSAGGPMSNMSGLTAACNVSDSKPMQFPLTQRRKRRVLFTQAQVSTIL